MTNRVSKLFGVEHPVVLGGVASTPPLGVAISNAGGLGCLASTNATPDVLRATIREYKSLTDKPMSVNFPIVLSPEKFHREKMELMVEEGVDVVISSAGNPKLWTGFLKERGVKTAHVVPTLYHAAKAVEAGVDAIIAEPFESGGYRGEHEVSMMVLIPAIHRAFPDVPVIAAGAISDGDGMAAAFALGAEGIQLGTRFMMTVEANSPDHVKRLILAATDTSTTSAEGKVKPRVSKPEFAEQVLGKKRQAQMGQVSALIDSIKTVEEVFRDLIQGGLESARRTEAAFAELAKGAPVA